MKKRIISSVLGLTLFTSTTAQALTTQDLMQYYRNPFKYIVSKYAPKKDDMIKVYKTVKNHGKMELEDLVYYGLIAEVGYPSFDMEAYKAQAVAIRTFILSNIKHKGEGFDLCGTTCCFALPTEQKIQGFTKEQLNRFKQAQEETKGQILTYDGKIISTPIFFAYGHNTTNTPNDIWWSDNNRYPYLKSVDTPEKIKPQEIIMNKTEFCNKLNIKNFDEFTIDNKNYNGYNKRVIVGDEVLNGNKLRSKLGLKSGTFDIYDLDDKVKIVCYGYGHGVGMSQFGANEFAKQGKKYNEILKHYYTGVDITHINDYDF